MILLYVNYTWILEIILKKICFDISIATSTFFCFVYDWHIFSPSIKFQPFWSLYFRWCCLQQHLTGYLRNQYDNFYLYIITVSPFMFLVIFDTFAVVLILLPYIVLSCVLCFTSPGWLSVLSLCLACLFSVLMSWSFLWLAVCLIMECKILHLMV